MYVEKALTAMKLFRTKATKLGKGQVVDTIIEDVSQQWL
jgi:hypothetical protein